MNGDDRLAELQRLRAAWPSKVKGTLADPFPHLTGWCNPSFPLGHDSHRRCSGYGPDSPTVGVMACICPCHLPGTILCGDATDADMAAVRGYAAALRNNMVEDYAAAVAATPDLSQGQVATVQQHHDTATSAGTPVEVTVTGDRWVWEADAAAELMLQPGGMADTCPMCARGWEAHLYPDDGRVACP